MPQEVLALRSAEDCHRLGALLDARPVIALWATVNVRSSVDVMLFFRNMLREKGYQTILLLRHAGVERFRKLCPQEYFGLVRQLDNAALLRHCPFINLLFTDDLCCGDKPAGFAGKVCLFPHNLSTAVPSGERYWADYAVAPTPEAAAFPFWRYPNSVKIMKNHTYTVIPAGYPKFDLLADARARFGPGPHRRISFYPFWLPVESDKAEERVLLWREAIKSTLRAFPDWNFVLRPFPTNRENPLLLSIREEFAAEPGFIWDVGDENITYIASADFMITDYSSVWKSFVYTALRPAIRLCPAEKGCDNGVTHEGLAYLAHSGAMVVDAVRHALRHTVVWEETIRRQRDADICHFGASCAYLCGHINDMLKDNPVPDWIVLNKGDTPYDRPVDWLRLLAEPFGEWKANDPPWLMPWSRDLIGADGRVALLFVRSCLLSWGRYYRFPAKENLRVQIEMALSAASPEWMCGLLLHMRDRHSDCAALFVWLAEVLSRSRPGSPELVRALDKALTLPLDIVLAGMAARLLRTAAKRSQAACVFLDDALARSEEVLPERFYVLAFCLRLENGRVREASALLDLWGKLCSCCEKGVAYFLCRGILEAAVQGNMPAFFISEGPLAIHVDDVPVSFQNTRQAHVCLKSALGLLRHRVREDPALNVECALLHGMSGQWASALLTVRKIADLDRSGRRKILALAEIMRANGENERSREVLRCLRGLHAKD